jgi:CDGSH-type Zn-finger protein
MPDPSAPRITIVPDGPYQVSGNVPLVKQTIAVDAEGECTHWHEGEPLHRHPHYALCRCGASDVKPMCDASHAVMGFDGTETADRRDYEAQADVISGPTTELHDAVALCADARFCHRKRIWNLVKVAQSDEDTGIVRHDAQLCPSGRYTAVDRDSGEALEPDLPMSIGLVEDPAENVSGPLWVRGGIAIESADGTTYEVRNRVTLCRCGASTNKPFCDGTHLEIGFVDEIEDD